jgi:two-component system CheB/CheR fusion protein
VVVDRRYDIQEINGAARRLLGIHTVAIGEDVLHLAQNVPSREFRLAIDKAIREKRVAKLNDVQIPQMPGGELAYVRIECHPQPGGEAGEEAGAEGGSGADSRVESVLVLIFDVTEIVQPRRGLEDANARYSAQAEDLVRAVADLRAANESLAASNQEISKGNAELGEARQRAEETAERHARQMELLAQANRELLSANEDVTTTNSELRSRLNDFLMTNEESQAAIEEAETLNEELQATNEELETLNEELQATVEELNTSNSDLAARGEQLQELASSLTAQQQHIEREKAQLEAILAGLADAVLVVSQEGEPLLTNEAYRRLFEGGEAGRDGARADGQTAPMADQQGQPLSPDETPQARAARGEKFSMTFTLAAPSGDEWRWLEAVGEPVHGDDEEKWGVVVFRDITERSVRILQEEFASLAAHELRTPLTAIKGYLRLLANSLAQHGTDRERHFAEIALSQVDRQTRLINDLVDVARLQSGKFSLRREPLDLATLLEQVAETAQVLANGQKIGLTIADSDVSGVEGPESTKDQSGARDGSEPMVVNADAARLEQAVLNLLTNAVTYAPGSPTIEMRLRRVDGMADIDVQDHGEGIAPEDLPGLFTRFHQLGRGTPLPAQGLGLGLFIARQIVEAHGGTISVASTRGEGTTFTIRLPLSG